MVSFRALSLFALAFSALSSSAPVPSQLESGSGSLEESGSGLEKRITHSGVATYYLQEGGTGACGWKKPDSAMIVATSSKLWKQNGSSNCGQYLQIKGRGKTEYAYVADECPECAEGHLDMSKGLFQKFASTSVGEFDISWHFMAKGWKP